MKRIMIGMVAVGCLVWDVTPAGAGVWVGGNGTWDDTTAANWSSPVAVPVNGDVVQLNQAGVSIGYTANNLSGIGLSQLSLNNTSGTTTFTLDGSDVLPVGTVVVIGASGGNSVFNLTDSALLRINGANSFTLGGATVASAIVNQTGGTFTNGIGSGSLFYIYNNGTYYLSAGALVANRDLTINGGTFNQTGGGVALQSGYGVLIGANGTFKLSGGIFTSGNIFTLAANATGEWTGGTITAPSAGGRLQLTGAGASWTQKGGTMTVNVGGNSGAITLTLVPTSTIQGYGTIQDARFGASSPGRFDNNGRIVANGYGVENTLDLSRFGQTTATSMVTNSIDNTTSNGWFATGKGKLLLPVLGVSLGDSAVNWGESASDTTPDLVNSARIAFTSATAGSLTGALYAVDRTDVPAGLYRPVGVWSFGGVTCTAATVTFRYDDAAAAALFVAEANLKVWRYSGTTWVDVTGSLDGTAKTITSQSVGSWPKAPTFFAVAPAEPPSEPPVIQNRPVSGVTTNLATFNGRLVANGSVAATVYVVWGETNGVWTHTNGWTAGAWADGGSPNTNIGLSADRTYYYTFCASNSVTNVVAVSPEKLITGALNVQATDPTGRVNQTDTMTFTVSRPATCTNEVVLVNYALSGTGTNGTDYTVAPVSGAVVIAQGQINGTIVVTPVWKYDNAKTVTLTLASGAYAIGENNSATGTLAAVIQTVPTARAWVGGSGIWDDTTTNNWSPAGVPANDDTVNIQSSAASLDIGYTAANLWGNGLAAVNLHNPGAGELTLTLDGADFLLVNSAFRVGGASAGAKTSLNIRDGACLRTGASGQPQYLGGGTNTATVNQTGGTNHSAYEISILTNGIYNLSATGIITSTRSLSLTAGTYSQTGGNASFNYGLFVGTNAGFSLAGGTFAPAGDITLGQNAMMNWTGGAFTGTISSLRINGPGAMWTMKGTSLGLNSGNPANGLFVTSGCTLQGYGQILDLFAGGSGAGKLDNSGRVVANGYGVDNLLDVSAFRNQIPSVSQVFNTTDNTTSNGWFAVNKGKLMLPNLAVPAGASTLNWGEAAAAPTIDLVNSARMTFTGATPGTLAGALYAADHGDVPPGLIRPAGVWSFGGVICTEVTVVFRYDDAVVPPQTALRVCRYDGVRWVSVSSSRDAVSKTISATLAGLSGTTAFLAVDVMQGSVFTFR